MGLPKNVQPHYERANPEHKKTMLALRKTILEVVPHADEVISYGMPAFKVEENIVAGIMAAKNHVGYYPFSGSVLHLFSKELSRYSTTKSALHVPVGESLSKALISKLVKARISQCPVKQGKVDLARYSKLDGFWRELGIAAPARRGLVDLKLLKLSDLKRITEEEFLDIHAMGPKAAAIIKKEMKKEDIKFKVSKK
jgi:uncharacterized protein YdhG (YjbR/CyaY superfamily)